MLGILLSILLVLTSIFLILLVLVQRGRGGGLAGALGGMGGQSAFGTKAGDLFTRITMVVATIWILLCVATVKSYSVTDSPLEEGLGAAARKAEEKKAPGNVIESQFPEPGEKEKAPAPPLPSKAPVKAPAAPAEKLPAKE